MAYQEGLLRPFILHVDYKTNKKILEQVSKTLEKQIEFFIMIHCQNKNSNKNSSKTKQSYFVNVICDIFVNKSSIITLRHVLTLKMKKISKILSSYCSLRGKCLLYLIGLFRILQIQNCICSLVFINIKPISLKDPNMLKLKFCHFY